MAGGVVVAVVRKFAPVFPVILLFSSKQNFEVDLSSFSFGGATSLSNIVTGNVHPIAFRVERHGSVVVAGGQLRCKFFDIDNVAIGCLIANKQVKVGKLIPFIFRSRCSIYEFG